MGLVQFVVRILGRPFLKPVILGAVSLRRRIAVQRFHVGIEEGHVRQLSPAVRTRMGRRDTLGEFVAVEEYPVCRNDGQPRLADFRDVVVIDFLGAGGVYRERRKPLAQLGVVAHIAVPEIRAIGLELGVGWCLRKAVPPLGFEGVGILEVCGQPHPQVRRRGAEQDGVHGGALRVRHAEGVLSGHVALGQNVAPVPLGAGAPDHRRRDHALVVGGVVEDGQGDLFQVRLAFQAFGPSHNAAKDRQQHAGQSGDNEDDHQQLDQREARPAVAP